MINAMGEESFECAWCKEVDDGDVNFYTHTVDDLAGHDDDGGSICVYCIDGYDGDEERE